MTRQFARVQRASWSLMAVIVMAALSGLTGGGGIWARQSAGLAEWPRVMRSGAASDIAFAGRTPDPGLGNRFTVEWLSLSDQAGQGERTRLAIRARGPGPARFTLATGLPAPDDIVHVRVLVLP